MADPTEPLLQQCATCGTLIDVTDEDPFALMHCPNCGAAMRVRRQFGNFELQEILGAGGMGAVYRALDTTLNREVAIKLLRKEYSERPEFIRQFEYEASITAHINHPNVVKVYSTGSDHGLFYIAMELVDKGSLDDLMTLQGRVSEAQVLEVGIQIAQGLDAAAKRGLIHRDVKPGNILFSDAHHAKIVDFGLATLMDKASAAGGEIWGTPYYVAPEKLDTPPKEDMRSDIYSLGATLFHAVAGRPPYEAQDASMVALKHLKSQPVSLQAFAPDVSTSTSYVINRALIKDPDQRYANYEDLIEHLEYAKREVLASAAQPKKKNRMVLEDEESQRLMSIMTIGILAALLLGGIGLFMYRDRVFGAKKSATPALRHETKNPVASAADAKVEAARQLLADGKYTEAAAAFDKLETGPELPQPQHNWVTLQLGLSQLLDGHPDQARATFGKLVERGPYTFDPSEEKLAGFFPDLGRRAADPTHTPVAEAKIFGKTGFEPMAALVLAAKDWQLGSFEDAGPLFRQFESSTPDGDFQWIAGYKTLASRYIEDFSTDREITERIKGARNLKDQKAVLPKVQEALTHFAMKGALTERAQLAVHSFEEQIANREQAETQKAADQSAADAKALAEAKTKINTLCSQMRFADAKIAIDTTRVQSKVAKHEHDVLAKRMEWLARFKAQLLQDLATGPYNGGVAKKGGAPLPGAVTEATDTLLLVKSAYGAVNVPWSDLSPDSVFNMARSFIRADLPPQAAADREWQLGAYAFLVGKPREAQALAAAAVKAKPEYEAQMPYFQETAPAPAATP